MGDRLEKNSAAVRKRIENHSFSDENGDEYEASSFGGFGDYFRRKKIKLQNLDAELRANAPAGQPQIFKGVVAHVMGYTQPSLQVLHKELVQHGAGFLQYLDSKTCATHIIASSLPPKKVVDYNKYRMVKPQWVVDSIRAGKLLSWTDYRVFDEGPGQKTLKFDGGSVKAETPRKPQLGYREQTQDSFYTKQLKKQAEAEGSVGSSPFRFMARAPATSSGAVSDGVEPQDPSPKRRPREVEQDHSSIFPGEIAECHSDAGSLLKPADLADKKDAPRIDAPGKKSTEETNRGRASPKKPMTSEEHNAQLLKDPKIWKSTTANPDFLKQFYSESRLHHLSTWKAELKSKMQKMAADQGPAPQRIINRRPGSRRYIMHVDFDSFFCAVSLKSAPEYINKPAVVAHGNGTGSEIASCNYAARAFGVKNGMWMKRALELCPAIKVLPYNFPAYEDASRRFYEAVLEVGGVVQSVSVDEALIDVTSLVLEASSSSGIGIQEGTSIFREQEKANEMAMSLRADIRRRTGCDVSVGIGPNILMAKVALRKAKPAGQHQVKPEDVLETLDELKVENLPGVAYSIKGKLEEADVRLVKDVRELSRARLASILGPKTGERLWEYSRGIDKAEVGDQPLRKSVSAEVNWGIRFVSQIEAEEFLMNLSRELERRLLNEGVKGKSLTLKIMRRALDSPLDPPKHLGHGKCDTFNKSVTFGIATHSAEFIGKEAVTMLRSYGFAPGDLRGLGVHLSRLEAIKGASTGGPENSQKTLSFGAFARAPSAKKSRADSMEQNGRGAGSSRRCSSGHEMHDDPISVEPLTPRKPRASPVHPAIALTMAREADAQATTPLNVSGTQFIIPSQADPEVIAALPQDIRARLMAQQKRVQSPARQRDEIPSDIDPEVFNGLPEDMKAEVLESYGRKGGSRQTVLPQSPRKDRIIGRPRPRTTPTKRGGTRGTLGRARERQHDAAVGLQQTNLPDAAVQRRTDDELVEAAQEMYEEENEEEIDPEVLAALPEDVRQEVIAEQQQQRLLRRRRAESAGLEASTRPQHQKQQQQQQQRQRRRTVAENAEDAQPRLKFPARPPRASFTKQNLTSLPRIKDMLQLWHQDTAKTGPHQRDSEVLETYLNSVVRDDKDMEKAQIVVAWLDWLVEEDDEEGKGKEQWRLTVRRIKRAVQKALAERGLGAMDFK